MLTAWEFSPVSEPGISLLSKPISICIGLLLFDICCVGFFFIVHLCYSSKSIYNIALSSTI